MSLSQPKKPPRYSSTYEDATYQYRHVIVDKSVLSSIPKTRLMKEYEWRTLGIQQGPHWEHYLIHKPEPFVLMFRRLLKYRGQSESNVQQQNTHFRTVRIPISATMNIPSSYPLTDSTNIKTNIMLCDEKVSNEFRQDVNSYKTMHDNNNSDEYNTELNESNLISPNYDE